MTIPLIPIILAIFPNNKLLEKLLVVVSVIVLLYYPIHKYRKSNFDGGLQKSTEYLYDINKLDYIKTTKETKQKVFNIYSDGIALKNKGIKTLYIGTKKYLYDYILENGKGYSLQEFHLPNETQLRQNIEPILKDYGAVCLLEKKEDLANKYNNFVDWLNKKGYSYYDSGKDYVILHKTETEWDNLDIESQ